MSSSVEGVEGVELGLPVERLPFLVSHCTCRPSALAARLMFLPASVRVGGDFPAAKTICQSGTPHSHTLAPRAGMADPCARLPLRVGLGAHAPEPLGHSFRISARLARPTASPSQPTNHCDW